MEFQIKYLLGLIIFFFAFSSCKKDEVIHTAGPAYGYAPTDTGRWILYDVDSTYYTPLTTPPGTNFRFQILERIDSTFIDNQGRPTQRLERFRRDSAAGAWDPIVTVWTSTLTLSAYERVEENIRYIKLGFPININTGWNGNAFNSLPEDDYYYDEVHTPYTLGTFSFDSALVVLRGEPPNAVGRKNGEEVFANHVGMIYKEFYNLDIQNFQDTTGWIYFYHMSSYGLHNAPAPVQ